MERTRRKNCEVLSCEITQFALNRNILSPKASKIEARARYIVLRKQPRSMTEMIKIFANGLLRISIAHQQTL